MERSSFAAEHSYDRVAYESFGREEPAPALVWAVAAFGVRKDSGVLADAVLHVELGLVVDDFVPRRDRLKDFVDGLPFVRFRNVVSHVGDERAEIEPSRVLGWRVVLNAADIEPVIAKDYVPPWARGDFDQ